MSGVAGGDVLARRAPRDAKLQFACRPLITGAGSSQAFLAASASLNVTYINIYLDFHIKIDFLYK